MDCAEYRLIGDIYKDIGQGERDYGVHMINWEFLLISD